MKKAILVIILLAAVPCVAQWKPQTQKARFTEFELCTKGLFGVGWLTHPLKPRWLSSWKITDNYPTFSVDLDDPRSCYSARATYDPMPNPGIPRRTR